MALIELVHKVPPSELELLKYGLSCYSWTRSKHRNCCYLLYSRRQQRCRRNLALGFGGGVALVMLFLVCGKNIFLWSTVGTVLIVLSIILLGWYCNSSRRIEQVLHAKVIAVIDFDTGCFSVRNYSRLPFVQILVTFPVGLEFIFIVVLKKFYSLSA